MTGSWLVNQKNWFKWGNHKKCYIHAINICSNLKRIPYFMDALKKVFFTLTSLKLGLFSNHRLPGKIQDVAVIASMSILVCYS